MSEKGRFTVKVTKYKMERFMVSLKSLQEHLQENGALDGPDEMCALLQKGSVYMRELINKTSGPESRTPSAPISADLLQLKQDAMKVMNAAEDIKALRAKLGQLAENIKEQKLFRINELESHMISKKKQMILGDHIEKVMKLVLYEARSKLQSLKDYQDYCRHRESLIKQKDKLTKKMNAQMKLTKQLKGVSEVLEQQLVMMEDKLFAARCKLDHVRSHQEKTIKKHNIEASKLRREYTLSTGDTRLMLDKVPIFYPTKELPVINRAKDTLFLQNNREQLALADGSSIESSSLRSSNIGMSSSQPSLPTLRRPHTSHGSKSLSSTNTRPVTSHKVSRKRSNAVDRATLAKDMYAARLDQFNMSQIIKKIEVKAIQEKYAIDSNAVRWSQEDLNRLLKTP